MKVVLKIKIKHIANVNTDQTYQILVVLVVSHIDLDVFIRERYFSSTRKITIAIEKKCIDVKRKK